MFQILEDRGFELCLVNARHVEKCAGAVYRRVRLSVAAVPRLGRIASIYGPEHEVCAVRSLLRDRESLVQMAPTHVNHMQKALDQMNVQLHHVIISDITGQTGLAIVDAVLAGEAESVGARQVAQLKPPKR